MPVFLAVVAVALLVVDAVVLRKALRSGRIYDCVEGSPTEGKWVSRDEAPGKFWRLIAGYALFCGVFAAVFVALALGGGALH